MTDLTADEFTVLSIASTGESMIPIGRWKDTTLALASRGLLRANDPSNYVITAAGREACVRDEDDSFRAILESSAKVQNARTQTGQSIEQAALHLSHAAKATVLIAGGRAEEAVDNWIDAVKSRAKELLADG